MAYSNKKSKGLVTGDALADALAGKDSIVAGGPYTHTFTAKTYSGAPITFSILDEPVRDESPEVFSLDEIRYMLEGLVRALKDPIAKLRIDPEFMAAYDQLVNEIVPSVLEKIKPVYEYLEAEKEQEKISGICPIHKKPRRKGGQCQLCMKRLSKRSGNQR